MTVARNRQKQNINGSGRKQWRRILPRSCGYPHGNRGVT